MRSMKNVGAQVNLLHMLLAKESSRPTVITNCNSKLVTHYTQRIRTGDSYFNNCMLKQRTEFWPMLSRFTLTITLHISRIDYANRVTNVWPSFLNSFPHPRKTILYETLYTCTHTIHLEGLLFDFSIMFPEYLISFLVLLQYWNLKVLPTLTLLVSLHVP